MNSLKGGLKEKSKGQAQPYAAVNSNIAPSGVGADTATDLSLPRTIVSKVENLNSSGIIQESSQTLTLYNQKIRLRMSGGPLWRDLLLGQSRDFLGSSMSWRIEAYRSGIWTPLRPVSHSFSIVGTNSTGTFVIRRMSVSAGLLSGDFSIVYQLRTQGDLKWKLIFDSKLTTQYRIVYDWTNISQTVALANPLRKLVVPYGSQDYIFSWEDVPPNYNTTTTSIPGQFSLRIDLGTAPANSHLLIDPTLVATSTEWVASGSNFQRHLFYEPTWGNYFVFYSNGSAINYKSSHDGISWSSAQSMPAGWPYSDIESSSPAVFNVGTQVIVAGGYSKHNLVAPVTQTYYDSSYWVSGTISGSSILWGPVNPLHTIKVTMNCGNFNICGNIGERSLNVGTNSKGIVAIALNNYTYVNGYCNSQLIVKFNNFEKLVDQVITCDPYPGLGGDRDTLRSIILPADSMGTFRIIYQYPSQAGPFTILRSKTIDINGNLGGVELIDSNGPYDDSFSAVVDASYSNHVVYYSLTAQDTRYAYHGASSSPWSSSPNPQTGFTLTIDYSTGCLYVFGIVSSSAISEASRCPGGAWSDRSVVFPVTKRTAAHNLGSAASSVSTVSNWLPVMWTEGRVLGSTFNVTFASIPIQNVWSPYGVPADPWDSNGLAPYGQYFANLGEYVSPYTGMLTVRQTDLSVPGRSLDFGFTRVYTEPNSFANNIPYNYESSYGFLDETFSAGWTVSGPGTLTTNGDIGTITVTSSGSPAITKLVTINTNDYPYLVWRLQGNANYQVGVWVGSTLYKYNPSSDPVTPTGWTTIAWDVRAVTSGATVTSLVLWAVGSTGTYAQYDYVGLTRSTVGNGWQLNYPWMSPGPAPTYLHLWDGEGYRLPSSFWTASTGIFENHQGEHFRLFRNATGIFLYRSSGVAYSFSSTSKTLNKITDPIGNNLTLSYDASNRLSTITDTVGRTFQLYHNTTFPMLLQSINQTSTGGASVRGVVFKYDGKLSLISVTDPAGRITKYSYSSGVGSDAGGWLLARITYPTQWYDNYAYQPALLGTQATRYRVSVQMVNATQGVPIRRFNYKYNPGVGDAILNSTIVAYDGSSSNPASYTDYAFSFAGVIWNISDSNHRFVRGQQQIFGVHGEVPREVILVSPTRSYTNYYRYDLWGNLIYSRRVINPSTNWYHESFNAYYNDGIRPGFNAFQETFRQNQGNATDNVWSTSNGLWTVRNAVYNGNYTNGDLSNTFAWSNTTTVPDVSVRARIYLAKQINTTAQAGIFVHYPGYGKEKWSLDLATQSGSTLIWLSDDGIGIYGFQTCSLPSILGSWYSFNLTIHGLVATGWVQEDGQPICGPIQASFPQFSIAVLGRGFGVLTGGFNALFANVTMTTVAPLIATTGFSNSFYNNGPPNSNIHNALAGTAELQNVTTTPAPVPMEAYQNFTSTGLLTQTKQFYLSQSGTQWLTSSRTYDRYGNPSQFTDVRGNWTRYNYSPRYSSAYLTSQTTNLVPGNTPVSYSYSYNFTTGTRTSVLDPRSYNTTYRYDILGRLVRTTYPTGDYVINTYNDLGNYVDTTNENGWKTRQIYDGLGRLSTKERFTGNIAYSNESYTYNWMDKVATRTDQLGNTSSYVYDALGRTVKVTQPDGNYTTNAYDDTAPNVQTTDQQGSFKYYVYDRLGRVIQVAEEQFGISSPQCPILGGGGYFLCSTYYSYDEIGNLGQVKNANSQSTFYSYDNMNRLTSAISPDGLTESYSYDNGGNLIKKIDRKNFATLYSYDSLNRVTSVTYSGSTVSNDVYTYDNNNNLRWLQSQNATLGYTYDSRNRVTGESYSINGGIVTSAFSLSNSGPISVVQGSNGLGTITATLLSGTSMQISLSCGNLPAGASCYFSPALGYPSFSASLTISTAFSTPPGNYTITVTGNVQGWRSAPISPTSFTLSVSASPPPPPDPGGGGGSVAAGTMITLANRDEITVEKLQAGTEILSYNTTTGAFTISTVTRMETVQTDNMLTIQTEDGQLLRTDNATIQQLWVKQGSGHVGWLSVTRLRVGDSLFLAQENQWTKVTKIALAKGSFTMYDVYTTDPYNYLANGYLDPQKQGPIRLAGSLSPLSPNTGVSGYLFNYTYNGDVLQYLLYSDGVLMSYTYDGLGRVQNLQNIPGPGPTIINTTISYYKNDRVKGISYLNGLVANYTYDKLARPATISLNNGIPNLLLLLYSYNKTGTVASVTGWVNQARVTEQYRYDPSRRLTNSTVISGGGTTSLWYQYDAVGNRIWQSLNSTKTSYTYNNINELTRACTAPNGSTCTITTVYSYYADGNLQTKNVTSASTTHSTYTWAPMGTLLRVNNDSGTQGIYTYDGLGRRVESKEVSSTIFYAYTGTETLAEQALNGIATDYVSAAGLRIVRVVTSNVNYYHTDALGSTRLVTDPARNVLYSGGYQPFGQDNGRPTGSETYKFTGKPYSGTTGLYYSYLRWYDPGTGRFLSWDTWPGPQLDPQSLNRYVYVRNSPTILVDRTGACSEGGANKEFFCGGGIGRRSFRSGSEDENWYKRLCGQGQNPFFCGEGRGTGASDEGEIGSIDTPARPTVSSDSPSLNLSSTVGEGSSAGSVEIRYVPRGGYEEARGEGAFGNQPAQLAEGNYADRYFKSELDSQGFETSKNLGGRFPDAWRQGEIVEIKPYHPGINPFVEYSGQVQSYMELHYAIYGSNPVFRFILYNWI